MRFVPTRPRRRQLLSCWRLLSRGLAASGLLLAAVLAAAAQRGLSSLALITGAALMALAALRAGREMRLAAAAARLQRSVECELRQLAGRGWAVAHAPRWPDWRGDGHLAITPAGDLAFAIRDCPPAIRDFDRAQAQALASALSRSGRPCIPICVGPVARSCADRGVVCCNPELLVGELLDAERAFARSLLDEEAHRQLLYGQGPVAAPNTEVESPCLVEPSPR